jgi:hypothetical protein
VKNVGPLTYYFRDPLDAGGSVPRLVLYPYFVGIQTIVLFKVPTHVGQFLTLEWFWFHKTTEPRPVLLHS